MATKETAAKPPHRHQIDAAPFRRILRAEVDRLTAEKRYIAGPADDVLSPISEVARSIWGHGIKGTPERRLFSIMNGEYESIDFDLADRILCRLNLVHLWLEDEELRELYMEANLWQLDVIRPTCEAVAEEIRSEIYQMFEAGFSVPKAAESLQLTHRSVRMFYLDWKDEQVEVAA